VETMKGGCRGVVVLRVSLCDAPRRERVRGGGYVSRLWIRNVTSPSTSHCIIIIYG